MGKYKSQWTGPQIDEGVGAARNPDTTPTTGSDALITSDAVAKVQQGFAPIETDATASQAYAIGDLLVWGGILYKAKTAIAVNDSFTVGTNIEATTIADKLNNIDTEITANTDTTLTGVLIGNGSKVGTKSLDTSSLTNDADHVPVSSVVKSAITKVETDLASIHATGSTNTTGAKIDAGTYFYLNNVLVKAKTDIAVNASYTSGTNYETVTAGALNDLSEVETITVTPYTNVVIDLNKSYRCGKNGILCVKCHTTATLSYGSLFSFTSSKKLQINNCTLLIGRGGDWDIAASAYGYLSTNRFEVSASDTGSGRYFHIYIPLLFE